MPRNQFNKFLHIIRKMLQRIIRQNVILFESVPPYSDNTWAVSRYIRNNGMLQNYKLEWILRPTDELRQEIPSFVRKDTRLGKLQYKIKLLHTKAFVFCNEEQYKSRSDQTTIYLGHGSCLKSDRGVYSMSQNLDYELVQAPAFANVTRYELTISDNTILAPLGYPRNDDFFGDAPLDRTTLYRVPFRKLIVC